MQAGYLVITADASNDEVVLLSTTQEMPEINPTAPDKIIWVGRFKDIDAAQMHAHGYYCRQLLDLDKHAYTVSKGRAIAAIESDQLLEETVFVDPDLSAENQADRQQWELYYKRRKKRFNTLILVIKVVALGYLLFLLVMGF